MDASASGNYALFDLVAALHWIQTNIADFGGDRSRVTLMGHGYGAALSHLLSLAPVTQRKKAILCLYPSFCINFLDLFYRLDFMN